MGGRARFRAGARAGTPNRSGGPAPFASRAARARVAEPSCLEPLERDERDDDGHNQRVRHRASLRLGSGRPRVVTYRTTPGSPRFVRGLDVTEPAGWPRRCKSAWATSGNVTANSISAGYESLHALVPPVSHPFGRRISLRECGISKGDIGLLA